MYKKDPLLYYPNEFRAFQNNTRNKYFHLTQNFVIHNLKVTYCHIMTIINELTFIRFIIQQLKEGNFSRIINF